jgi:hypothetical protein
LSCRRAAGAAAATNDTVIGRIAQLKTICAAVESKDTSENIASGGGGKKTTQEKTETKEDTSHGIGETCFTLNESCFSLQAKVETDKGPDLDTNFLDFLPVDSYKKFTDAWQGFHMIPLHEDSREFTNFVTEWGMFLLQEDADGGPHVDGRIQLQVRQGRG